MGYMRSHAIVVTSWDEERIKKAHETAKALMGEEWDMLVSPIMPSMMNGYASFFIAPDGSKEGWGTSVDGDTKRAAVMDAIDKMAYEDGGNAVDYAEVFFGDDNGESAVTRHN